MIRKEHILIRDIIRPSFPDGGYSVKDTQSIEVIIEWPDEIVEYSPMKMLGGAVGEWRILDPPSGEEQNA